MQRLQFCLRANLIGVVTVFSLIACHTASAFSECGVLEQQGNCLMFRSDGNMLYELLPPPDGFEPGDRVRLLGNEELDCPLTCPVGDGCITNAKFSGCHHVCTSSTMLTESADFALGNTINLNSASDELRIHTWTQTESANPPVLPHIWYGKSEQEVYCRYV